MGEVLRRTKNGKFVGFTLRWYEGGKRRVMASKQSSAAAARRMLAAIEGRIACGRTGLVEPKTASPTVAELVERFLDEYSRPRITDLTRYRRNATTALRRALPTIGSLRADAVQGADVNRLRESLMKRWAPNSTRLTLFTLSTVFAWAVRLGLVPTNPVKGVELPPRQSAMDYLTADEVRALLTAAAQQARLGTTVDRCLHAAIRFALHTGVRKGELAALRWRDVDVQSGRLTIARSFSGGPKSGRIRHLRLPAAVVPVLRAWQPECPPTASGLIFPRRHRDGTWNMIKGSSELFGLPALLKAAGCRPLARPWHTLRHTMASHYMMAGGSLLALSKILGHSDIKVTMVYAHLSPDFMAQEMDRLKYE